ncbi:hypothetical protein L4D09_24380 [Photobacterium makurazakiensis]|uniref:hypothetical protein n=1 Tax=Photobacterium makurazakiensis TaxID=2910234 RepID=UPI003D0FCCE4
MLNKQFENKINESLANIQALLTINFDTPYIKLNRVIFDNENVPEFEVHFKNPMNVTDKINLSFGELVYFIKNPKDLIVHYHKERYIDYLAWLNDAGLIQCSQITTTGARCKCFISNKTHNLTEHIKLKNKGRLCTRHTDKA